MTAASSHTDKASSPAITISHENRNRATEDPLRIRREVLKSPKNSQSKTKTESSETKPCDVRTGVGPYGMTSAQSGTRRPTPVTCSVVTDEIRAALDQLSRDFNTMCLSEFYKPECWSEGVFPNNDEKLYVLTGLHYMTQAYKPKVPLDGPRYVYTSWWDASSHVKGRKSETPRRNHELNYVSAGEQWFLDPNDSWYPSFRPEWICGYESKLSRDTRMELDHVIWSVYSWCCGAQGKEVVDETTLLTWMGKHQSVIEQQCRLLRNKVRFEHSTPMPEGADPLFVCSTTNAKSSEDDPKLLFEVFSARTPRDSTRPK